MTKTTEIRVAEIDARCAEIEQIDYDTCPAALIAEHDALVAEKFTLVPCFGATLVLAMQGIKS